LKFLSWKKCCSPAVKNHTQPHKSTHLMMHLKPLASPRSRGPTQTAQFIYAVFIANWKADQRVAGCAVPIQTPPQVGWDRLCVEGFNLAGAIHCRRVCRLQNARSRAMTEDNSYKQNTNAHGPSPSRSWPANTFNILAAWAFSGQCVLRDAWRPGRNANYEFTTTSGRAGDRQGLIYLSGRRSSLGIQTRDSLPARYIH